MKLKPGERLPYRYGMVKKGTNANQFQSVEDIDGNGVKERIVAAHNNHLCDCSVVFALRPGFQAQSPPYLGDFPDDEGMIWYTERLRSPWSTSFT